MASVSILGCGWLGLPLAKQLINQSYTVKGSTTSTSKLGILKEEGVQAFKILLPEQSNDPAFFNSDYLIINIPPKTSNEGANHHYDSIKSILKYIPATQKIIYVSATSVYPAFDHPIDEESELDHQSERARALIKVEQLLKNTFKTRLNIIRFGGLLGYDRIPGRYYSGKKLEQHQQKVNYIHRDDAIGIIEAIIKQGKWSHIFNGVAPIHPTKEQVFKKNAADFNFEPPLFPNKDQELKNRYIESRNIELILDYSFFYPDPLHFFYTN